MQQSLIVGIDVSKSTLDSCFWPSKTFLHISNNNAGFKQWIKQLRQLCTQDQKVLVVMEHTGQYSSQFELFLQRNQIGYCKVPALHIKRSIGLTRGKNDKIDAARIAEFAWHRRDVLLADEVVEKKVLQLRTLLTLRTHIVRTKSGFICRLKEAKACKTNNPVEMKVLNNLINAHTRELEKIESQIQQLIHTDESLCKTYELLISIKGIGPVVAAFMIAVTNDFKKFSSARKFNCYAGIAPFKHESGSSIRGKARVSHLANKEAKTLLNLAALNAIRFNLELKDYYQRRIAEGKNKMQCINIIRSKLVARMFAVVHKNTPYVQQLTA